MFKNRKFGFYAATLCLTGLLYAFLCAGLDGGQMQIIRSVITPEGGGWSPAQIQLPMTVGDFLAVPLAVVCCGAFLRSGVRQTLIPCAAAAALGCVGLVCANGLDIYGGAACGIYPLFFLSLAVIRCACAMVQAALAALCLQWFIRLRGRALGVVFMGAPLFSAVGAPALANFVRTVLGGDHRPFYVGMAVLLGLLALVTRFLLRDRPEEAGLYPDGDGRAPISEPDEEEPPMSLARVLKNGRTWLVLIALGGLTFAAAGGLDFLEARLLARGGGPALLDRAAPWLALGAILGIPASYIFGWLCDRLGELWTALLLGLTELGSICLLWHFPGEGGTWAGIGLCLASACLMSGPPVVVPCVIGHLFGRRQFLPVCRVLFPALLLAAALVNGPVGALLGSGVRASLYLVLFCAVCVGFLACLLLLAVGRVKTAREKAPEDKE